MKLQLGLLKGDDLELYGKGVEIGAGKSSIYDLVTGNNS
jgi:hypothetical protein